MPTYKAIPKLTPNDLARFFAKVEHDERTGCLLYTGATNRQGYGSFAINGKSYIAHRVMMTILGKPVALDMQLNHTCPKGRKNCLNHVEICDRSHNIRYARDHEGGIGRQRITREVAEEIKNRSAQGHSPKHIADDMSIEIKIVYSVRSGWNWGDLESLPIPRLRARKGHGRQHIALTPSGRYQTSLTFPDKSYYLGTFDTREQAIEAVRLKREQLGLCTKAEFGDC